MVNSNSVNSKSKPAQKEDSAKTVSKSSNSNLFLVGGVVLVVIVLLVMLLPGLNKTTEKKTFVCPDGSIVASEEDCLKQEIPLTPEEKYEFCMDKTLIQEKDECLQDLAIESNNDILCDELVNLDLEKCKRLVWKEYAVVSQELSKCSELLTKFDEFSCIKEIALNASDPSICSKITEVIQQNSCLIELAAQEEDLGICSLISGSAAETCKFNAALAIGDADLCDAFSLPSIKYDCITRIAEKNNDVSLCNKISDSLMKNRCVINLS